MSSWGDYRKQQEKLKQRQEEEAKRSKEIKEREAKVIEVKQSDGTVAQKEKTFKDRFQINYYIKLAKFGSVTGASLGGILGAFQFFQTMDWKLKTNKDKMLGLTKSTAIGAGSLICFYVGMMWIKRLMGDMRGSYDVYNTITASALCLMPCMKIPVLKKNIMYPLILVGFDLFSDYRDSRTSRQ
ncbi:hypothetical protein WA158_001344 [Blastocystis sp. Blastoise]